MTVLIAGCLVSIVNFGVRSTFGQFTQPITEFYQWPRETYSFAMALQNLLWGAMTPVAGLAGKLKLSGALGSYRELPINPSIAGCVAVIDAKASANFGL